MISYGILVFVILVANANSSIKNVLISVCAAFVVD